MSYVPLERRFFRQDRNHPRPLPTSPPFFRGPRGATWDEVLQHRFVVILGEPGTGKSTEFKEKTNSLVNDGDFAFYLHLSNLQGRALGELLNLDERRRFEAWQQSERDAHFFLDSIDEAKLEDVDALSFALRQLERGLDGDAVRTRIYLSSRVTDWTSSDIAKLTHELKAFGPASESSHSSPKALTTPEDEVIETSGLRPNSHESKSLAFSTFVLAPVTEEDARRLIAESYDDVDINRLFQEVDALRLRDVLLARPLDILGSASLWREEGSLESLSRAVLHGIRVRLRENPGNERRKRRDTLESEGALRAAAMASAVLSLGQMRNIALDQNEPAQRSVLKLASVAEILNLSPEETRVLLGRPIFGQESHGSVRIVQRDFQEFLVAWWLYDLRRNHKCQVDDLLGTLFYESRERTYVARPLVNIIGWLATFDQEFASAVVDRSPEVFLEAETDASQLSLGLRRTILERIVGGLSLQGSRLNVSDRTLRTFSDRMLADDVLKHLKEAADPALLHLLLKLSEYCETHRAIPVALGILKSTDQREFVRRAALRLLCALGDAQDKQRVVAFMKGTGTTTELLASAIECLFGTTIGTRGLVELLQSPAARQPGGMVTSLPIIIEHTVLSKCDESDLYALLATFIELLLENGADSPIGPWTQPSDSYEWLVSPATRIVERLLNSGLDVSANKAFVSQVAQLLRLTQYSHRREGNAIREALEKQPELRRGLFLLFHDNSHTDVANVAPHYFQRRVGYSASDAGWIVLELEASNEPVAQALISYATNLLQTTAKLSAALRRDLLAAIEDHHGLSSEIGERLAASSSTSRNVRSSKADNEPSTRDPNHERLEKLLEGLTVKKLLALETAQDDDLLAQVFNAASRLDRHSHSKYGVSDLDPLLKQANLSEDAVEAVLQGLQEFWRSRTPVRVDEAERPNRVPLFVGMGLTGIHLELKGAENGNTKYSAEEAETAARYALREINGFPPWFGHLIEAHPIEVLENNLEPMYEWIFRQDCESFDWSTKLDSLRTLNGDALNLASLRVLKILSRVQPQSQSTLRAALRQLLRADDEVRNKLGELADVRTGGDERAQIPHQAIWLAAWLCIDGEKAWQAAALCFERNTFMSSKCRNAFVEKLAYEVHKLNDLKWVADAPHSFKNSPTVLGEMIAAFFSAMPPSQDRVVNRAYFVTPRDEAREMRQQAVRLLSESGNVDAPSILLKLHEQTNNPGLDESMYFVRHAHFAGMRLAETQLLPWSLVSFREFQQKHARPPTSQASLYAYTLRLLRTAATRLERDDFSLREAFTHEASEALMQKWLASQLRELGKGFIRIYREPEVDQDKKPDIVISSGAGRVAIEVKPLFRRYSFNYLCQDTLKEQLVEKYMRTHDSTHGVLVLFHVGAKSYWCDSERQRYYWEDLIPELNSEAARLRKMVEGVTELAVVGINCCS